MGRGRVPVTKRTEEHSATMLDLDALETFCASARDKGAPGAAPVRARVTWRGVVRSLRVEFVFEEPAPPNKITGV